MVNFFFSAFPPKPSWSVGFWKLLSSTQLLPNPGSAAAALIQRSSSANNGKPPAASAALTVSPDGSAP